MFNVDSPLGVTFMIWATAAVILGIALTVISADKFVEGAASLASRLGMSHFIIGLTIISVGTSAPELLVSAVAAFEGSPGLALGNALGSNITNIALVLGATACIFPLLVPRQLVSRELPLLIIICIGVYALAFRGIFDLWAGLALVVTLPLVLYQLMKDEAQAGEETEIPDLSLTQSVALTIGGLLVLLGSSKALVWGATEVARYFGVSELIIGLTIVAIGTSLPELAASIASAMKNKTDMALGTVIGSNFFNFLGVIGIAALISPFAIEAEVLTRDLPWTLGLTLMLWIIARFGAHGTIKRSYGILLLLLYVSYLWHISATIVPN
jgi:cation:H+ antiporter